MSRRILAVVVASALLGIACVHEGSDAPQPVAMTASDKVPAASGQFEVSKAGNGNTALHVAVSNMAPPQKVAAGATTYVVWVRPLAPDGHAQNIGALRIDGNLQGALDSVTPLHAFDVFVTPEQSPAAEAPRGQALLWGRVGQ